MKAIKTGITSIFFQIVLAFALDPNATSCNNYIGMSMHDELESSVLNLGSFSESVDASCILNTDNKTCCETSFYVDYIPNYISSFVSEWEARFNSVPTFFDDLQVLLLEAKRTDRDYFDLTAADVENLELSYQLNGIEQVEEFTNDIVSCGEVLLKHQVGLLCISCDPFHSWYTSKEMIKLNEAVCSGQIVPKCKNFFSTLNSIYESTLILVEYMEWRDEGFERTSILSSLYLDTELTLFWNCNFLTSSKLDNFLKNYADHFEEALRILDGESRRRLQTTSSDEDCLDSGCLIGNQDFRLYFLTDFFKNYSSAEYNDLKEQLSYDPSFPNTVTIGAQSQYLEEITILAGRIPEFLVKAALLACAIQMFA